MSDIRESKIRGIPSGLTGIRRGRQSKKLISAAYEGDLKQIGSLLDSGFMIDTIDRATGMSALHIAVGRNDIDMVKLLIERGATFFADGKGRWPTTIASICEVSEELCDYIAEAEAKAEGV